MLTQARVGAASVNDVTAGDFLRVVRRTVHPADDADGMYDVELEFERLHEVDPDRPDAPADDRIRWVLEPWE
ncbi:MAG: hypothetical protein RL139_95 [Gemmatimonadota bacterium]|jgi:hypothetical protein